MISISSQKASRKNFQLVVVASFFFQKRGEVRRTTTCTAHLRLRTGKIRTMKAWKAYRVSQISSCSNRISRLLASCALHSMASSQVRDAELQNQRGTSSGALAFLKLEKERG